MLHVGGCSIGSNCSRDRLQGLGERNLAAKLPFPLWRPQSASNSNDAVRTRKTIGCSTEGIADVVSGASTPAESLLLVKWHFHCDRTFAMDHTLLCVVLFGSLFSGRLSSAVSSCWLLTIADYQSAFVVPVRKEALLAFLAPPI